MGDGLIQSPGGNCNSSCDGAAFSLGRFFLGITTGVGFVQDPGAACSWFLPLPSPLETSGPEGTKFPIGLVEEVGALFD